MTGSEVVVRSAGDRLGDLLRQWRWSLRNALLAAVAAGVTWWLAGLATADSRPVAAAVTAVVALAPGIANPRIQLAGFIIGFCTGLAIGAVARPFLYADPTFTTVPVAFVAIMAASSFGRNPITLIQSGATALLVVGPGTATALLQFQDSLVGAAVASALSQIFFAPDPVPMLEGAAACLVDAAERLRAGTEGRPRPTWDDIAAATDAFERALAVAKGVRRWTLRGRLGAARIAEAERTLATPVRRLAATIALASLDPRGPASDALGPVAAAIRRLLDGDA